MRKLLLIIVLLIGWQLESYSCSCGWGGPFLKVASDTSLVDFVAVVKIKKHLNLKGKRDVKTPMSMEVEIVETLYGKEHQKTIEVWGDNGMMCRPYISEFPEGTTWILALRHGSEEWGHLKETASDYSISICGEYSLRSKGRKVIGLIERKEGYYTNKQGKYIKSKDEKISFKRFKRKFKGQFLG